MTTQDGAKARAPYGSWTSPITADRVAGATLGLGQTQIAGSAVFWTELRPLEGGRVALMAREESGVPEEVSPADMSVRTRAHEYGGGAYAVFGDRIVFVNDADGRVYTCRRSGGDAPSPITPGGRYRYADFDIHPTEATCACVREDHGAHSEPKNEIVLLDLEAGGAGEVIASGSDFYAAPRFSPGGGELAYIAWNHPNMPWDGTELWAKPRAGGEARLVAGGPDESIFQPAWSPGGTLHFASDRTGWWNLYAAHGGRIEPVVQMEAEIGRPHWQFGTATYGFGAGGELAFAYREGGRWRLARREPSGETLPFDLPYTEIDGLAVAGDRVSFVGGAPTAPAEVAALSLHTGERARCRRAAEADVDPGYLSEPEAITYPTSGGDVAHALYYAPRNRDFTGPEDEAPPLLVLSHGGPTGSASSALRYGIQFWTSRGFAVVDVDYRGSSGYGRAYRDALRGRWGVADVDDCVHAARFLAESGRADPERLLIRGGSAGGYTTLQALTTTDAFAAGASHFGVSDLAALAEHTHKFESRYLDSLIGPYPEAAAIYRERSPIENAQDLSSPVIFLQGLEDKIVPPEQSERMAEVLREKGIPVAYLAFEGEQHGFRRADNIRRALEAELYFYSAVLGFSTADDVEPVHIDNL